MIQLSDEQCAELSQAKPIAVDPNTSETYVLVRKSIYDRLKNLIEDDDARLMYPLLADVDPEDWEDETSFDYFG